MNKYKPYEFCNSWTRVRLSHSGFHAFRKEMHEKYHPSMVRVERDAVYADGTTYAKILHASGLGAELRAQSYSHGAVDVDSKG